MPNMDYNKPNDLKDARDHIVSFKPEDEKASINDLLRILKIYAAVDDSMKVGIIFGINVENEKLQLFANRFKEVAVVKNDDGFDELVIMIDAESESVDLPDSVPPEESSV